VKHAAKRVCAAALALAAAPALGREPRPSPLKAAIDRIVEAPAFAAAFWAVEVRDVKSGRVLYARNVEKHMKPASTLKLLTTAAALDVFGPDHRIRTSVETAGRQDSFGRILGDVYLVGRGDANLSGRFSEGRITAAFESLADALKAAGLTRIEGRLVGHEGLFKGDRRGDDWGWEDLVWWYGAEISALSFNDNCADLKASAGERPGDPLVIERNPLSAYYQVISTATTSPAGSKNDDLTLVRELGSNVIRLSGTYPIGEKPWQGSVALEDPARYAATVFGEVLASRGIRVTGGVATSSEPLPAGARVLAFHEGPSMREVIQAVNKPSQNLHTEILLRLLGAHVKSEGSVAKGIETLAEFLKRQGIAEQGALRDASGLSRSDLITAHDIVSLLVAMDRHPHAQAFKESLPIAGVDGTLKNRMKGTPAAERVVAKTGSLRNVNALAGYATARHGERLAFAIVLNHHTLPAREATGAIDAIVKALVTK
jgi:D-alanyl-D-alanine carboxypeptidase/D-alanyl-D-alanine-endopeptidase (penicillin-binding protein 4)